MAAQLGLPPGYRFVPTDEELVRLHLLPCILDQPQPRNDIIVDDPLSAPPWALLEKHGRKQEAFFFAVGQAMNAKGNRQKRTCEGHGTWQGQGKRKREEEGKESKKRMRVSVCGSTKEIEWEKYGLNFQERGVKGSNDEDDDEVDDATLATTWCAAEEDPALFIGEYPLAPQAEYVTSLPMAVADVVNAIPADGSGAGAGNDQDLPALVLDDATTWSAAEEDPTLFIGEYPLAPQAEYVTSLPVAVADVVNANPADGEGAGAGNDQDLPGLVEDDNCFAFMNSLSDLVPGFDLLQ
jgi:hypothetical protein